MNITLSKLKQLIKEELQKEATMDGSPPPQPAKNQEAAKEAAETVKEVAKETSSDYRSGLTDTGKAIYDSMSAYGFTQDEIDSTIESGGHKK